MAMASAARTWAFQWALPDGAAAVCLDEVLKLSLEMKTPLVAAAIPRTA
ncbi:Cytochrome P450 CYP78A1 [Zea mays]|uniref:Cytochrome P450 CYP78A1 n=1 Tax=Zea mays TaxID=4577 RepID=A0A1D6KVT2_MAIZE|nr:Cytochrome P450 CYP78A1 [Zea mays]